MLQLGAQPLAEGVRFEVWAPRAQKVAVTIADLGVKQALVAQEHGYFTGVVKQARPGARYKYELDDGQAFPDPVSRFQPDGVHGASCVVDPAAHRWTDGHWKGVPFETYVIYELHVGTFTREGTFDAAVAKLPYLKDLGVTAVELMPVNQFPGVRNWGYDGAYLFAPQNSYGGPEGLKRLVDACHAHGLACVMDVVYNHMGPEGNYVGFYGPYFTERYHTPWGAALNFDDAHSDPVRRFFLDNALYWLSEYHFDALRLDAIHGIFDFSALHILAEMKNLVEAESRHQGRPLYLIAESDLNDVRVIAPREKGGHGMDAQWSDDFHHALFTAMGAPRAGYFSDFGQVNQLAKAIKRGFVYDGLHSSHRKRRHGNDASQRPGRQFVTYTQNHDQVANGSQGARMSTRMDAARERLAAAMLLVAPNTPMLFMGQEYGETNPFSYFVDHGDPELCTAVREGRRAEFEAFGFEKDFEDPTAESTYQHSKLDWAKLEKTPHAQILALYKALLALRAQHPALKDDDLSHLSVARDDDARWVTVLRRPPGETWFATLANLSDQAVKVPLPAEGGKILLATDEPRFGGNGGAVDDRPLEAAARELTLGPWAAVLLTAA